MATVPTTILVQSQDPTSLTTRMVYVVCKQLFRYGVKRIKERENQVQVDLTYSPTADTLRRKLSALPVQYFRVALDNDDDINVLENVMTRYGMAMRNEGGIQTFEQNTNRNKSLAQQQSLYLQASGSGDKIKIKRLHNVQDIIIIDDGDNDDDDCEIISVEKRKEHPKALPAAEFRFDDDADNFDSHPKALPAAEFRFDDDADNFDSQKCHVVCK